MKIEWLTPASADAVLNDELSRPGIDQRDWHGNFWIRDFLWPLPIVALRQFRGTRYNNGPTGVVIPISLPRYWWFLWRLRRERPSAPIAKVVRR